MSGLPQKWVYAPLGVLGEWRGGSTPRKANAGYWRDGTLPWVSPKDMKTDVIRDAEDKVTARAVLDGAVTPIPAGALLVVTRSGILAHSVPVAVTTIEAAINQDLKALVPAEGIDARFLAEQIRFRAPELLTHAGKAGTTVESLVFDRLKSFLIRLAPAGEQTRIAERLAWMRSKIAAARDQADRLTEAVARIRNALADQMARGHLATSGDAPPTPVERRRLGDLLIEPGRTGLSVKGRLEPPGVRALRLSALRGAFVDMNDVRYLPIDETRSLHLRVRPGDVLISRGSGSKALVGRASLVRRVAEHTIFPDTAYRVRLDPDQVSPEWFVAIWNAPATRLAFESRIRTTAGIWKVGWRDLRDTKLLIPTLEKQRDALEAFRAAGARLDLALSKRNRAVRLLDRFEQAMVARAFEGGLVPQREDEEDAASILARIEALPAAPPTPRTRRVRVPHTRDAFRELVAGWPADGQSFEQVRDAIAAKYDELRDIVFEAIEDGLVQQRFDPKRGLMVLERSA